MRLGDEAESDVGLGPEGDVLTPGEKTDFARHCMEPGIGFLDEIGEAIEQVRQRLGEDRTGLAAAAANGVWSINLNRPVDLATCRSNRTVKADAAVKVFEDASDAIVWAVVDSGIDATHPAFLDRKDGAAAAADPIAPEVSRIRATYDFTRLRHLVRSRYSKLVSKDDLDILARQNGWNGGTTELDRREAIFSLLYARYHIPGWSRPGDAALQMALGDDRFRQTVTAYAETLRRDLEIGRMIDWALVAPLIAVPHRTGDYTVPSNSHGTHVGGILIGDWREGEQPEGVRSEPVCGICPKMSVYDLRVCDENGRGEEFVVLAALQFVAHLNRDRDQMRVHGINISLSIRHDVANYACGQTPVCLECERLVGDGVVVVAAAGNKGFQKLTTENGLIDGYNAISITDPGNAAGVITVGATHRSEPHSFGVSYFSSRGPTGDGRDKPDLVAPGEKIRAPVPGPRTEVMDGTSMAAPHVSGAAAQLMGRHRELVGAPVRIKRILCDTATDLGRKREFQGAGLVDILRALQSV
jgi:subtilisin family serine protease